MTRAAENLYMAQPAVSRAISELEVQYGTKFFERISRRLEITEAGKAYYSDSINILGLIDRLDLHMKNIDKVGTICVGTSITIGTRLLPDIIVRFAKEYPEIKVKVVIENSYTIEEMVLNNKLDLGIIEGSAHFENIFYEDFRPDHMSFICSKNHEFANQKIDLEELNGCDFLLREEGSAGREQFEYLRTNGNLNANTLWQSASTKAIISGVQRNIGISLLPRLLVEDCIASGEVSEFVVKNVEIMRYFKVTYHKNKFFTPALRYLKEHVIMGQ
jgi:DNA-binding transcriptional LysR family regulator